MELEFQFHLHLQSHLELELELPLQLQLQAHLQCAQRGETVYVASYAAWSSKPIQPHRKATIVDKGALAEDALRVVPRCITANVLHIYLVPNSKLRTVVEYGVAH